MSTDGNWSRCSVCGCGGFHAWDCGSTEAVRQRAEAELEVEKAWRTHHAPGSAEELHSRRVRFDKYLAMQGLLVELKAFDQSGDPRQFVDYLQGKAGLILAGMQPTFRQPDRPERSLEVFKILCDLTLELTRVKASGDLELAVENFAPELLGKLLAQTYATPTVDLPV